MPKEVLNDKCVLQAINLVNSQITRLKCVSLLLCTSIYWVRSRPWMTSRLRTQPCTSRVHCIHVQSHTYCYCMSLYTSNPAAYTSCLTSVFVVCGFIWIHWCTLHSILIEKDLHIIYTCLYHYSLIPRLFPLHGGGPGNEASIIASLIVDTDAIIIGD